MFLFGSIKWYIYYERNSTGFGTQFGDPKRVIQKSGLHIKIPFIQNVVRYDNRILEYNLPIEEVIAVDKEF